MKMLTMLMVAAILFCSHQQGVVAREVAVTVDDDGNEVEILPCWIIHWPWCPSPPPPPSPPPKPTCSASDQEQVKTCMFNVTSIDACCPTFKSILRTSCPCFKYAEDLDNQVLITLQAYCDVDSPCRNVQLHSDHIDLGSVEASVSAQPPVHDPQGERPVRDLQGGKELEHDYAFMDFNMFQSQEISV